MLAFRIEPEIIFDQPICRDLEPSEVCPAAHRGITCLADLSRSSAYDKRENPLPKKSGKHPDYLES
jgi:hypothetical protein